MTDALVDVSKLDFYKKVYDESVKFKDVIKRGYWEVVLYHYRWGRFLSENVETKYADAVMSKLSEELQISASHLYRIMQFGKRFATEAALETYRNEAESAGYTLTWTYIKNNVLPDSTKKPDAYGGQANVADELMRETETMSIKMEKLREMLDKEGLDLDTKQQVAGVLLQAQEVIAETVSTLTPQLSPRGEIPRSTMYLDYVRSLSCIICEKQAQAHHVEVGGVGMKGSDYVTIPLCADHHRELHDRGDESFQQWYGLDFNAEVIKCLAQFVRAIEEVKNDS